jgi:hypothetical protein
MMISIGFTFRFDAVVADAGEAGIGDGSQNHRESR